MPNHRILFKKQYMRPYRSPLEHSTKVMQQKYARRMLFARAEIRFPSSANAYNEYTDHSKYFNVH